MSDAVYRGPDRRRRLLPTGRSTPGTGAAIAVAVAVGGAVLAADLLRTAGWAVALRPVADTFGIVATALFFGAGVLRHARWRMTGEAYMAASSAALLVFAVASLPVAMVVRAFGTAGTTVVLASLARSAAVLVVAVILAPALTASEVDSGRRPGRLATRGVVAALAVFVALALLLRFGDVGLLSSTVAASALELVGAAVWLLLAGLCARAASWHRSSSLAWTSAALMMLGLAAVMRSLSRTEGMSWLVAAGGLTVVAAWASAVNAVADVREALAGESDELLTTSGALADAERVIAGVEARRRELVHDARSMIGALRAASSTLDRHARDLDPATTQRLRSAMDLELERLGRLIEDGGPEQVRAFEVSSALAPGLALLRSEGLDVADRLEPTWATGRPEELAHVVHNLVVNARRHAPGSRVTVRCEEDGDTVRVHVEDDGPGVPAGLRDRVFDRGVRGGPGSGEGLGLYLARRLMRDQGGDLGLRPRAGGGADFVASLPAAGASPAYDAGKELVETSGAVRGSDLDPLDHDAGAAAGVVGQHDDHARTGRSGTSHAEDGDVHPGGRAVVGAPDDPVPVVGERPGDEVGEQAGAHVDGRPAIVARSRVHHRDEPVTAGAPAPRLS
ncbi:MAG TPA: HAMP domain-containing sensor histidine kinase [Candidatus Angelobacter sp.]|nr:HAMP domain-containing sensor histidine kinase [Candidatus Angelobacter sp.]